MSKASTIPPAVEAAVGVLMAADHLQTTFAEICERYGVTTDQYKVLRILREAPPGGFARGEVAERCIFSPSPHMTRMPPAPGDRRCSIATITRAGRAVLNRIDPEIAAAARRLTKSLSSTQLT